VRTCPRQQPHRGHKFTALPKGITHPKALLLNVCFVWTNIELFLQNRRYLSFWVMNLTFVRVPPNS